MKFSVQQIADLLEGSIDGNKDAVVSSLSKLKKENKEHLAFCPTPNTLLSFTKQSNSSNCQ